MDLVEIQPQLQAGTVELFGQMFELGRPNLHSNMKPGSCMTVYENLYGKEKIKQVFKRFGWNLNADKNSDKELDQKKN